MAAKLLVKKWTVTGTVNGELEVRTEDDGNRDGPRIEIEQGSDIIWVHPDDVPALLEALRLAKEGSV